jgi:Domain of unknown function (DUF4352)
MAVTTEENQMKKQINLIILSLIGLLLMAGCAGGQTGAGPTATTAATPVASHPGATTVPGGNAGASATNTPQGNKANSNLDCQALANAAFDLNSSQPSLVMLTSSGGSVQNRVDSAFYIDTTKMRADLDVLAVLPDPTDATEIAIMGVPSEAIAQYRQLFDIVDRDANASSTPAANGGVSDQQLAGFTAKLIKIYTAINAAVGKACPNATADASLVQPASQPTPLTASYSMGQTAQVGELRVTLDRVAAVQVANTMFLTAGNHYVLAYFTVENTGKTTYQMNAMSGTHWEDAAGKPYYFDPNTITLDPNTTNFDGGVEAGAKKSGAVGYQLPIDAGDLVWVFEDFKPNRAVFTVKPGDIGVVGTPVGESTAVAMQADANATQTAFVEIVMGVATEDAAITETPAPPEPVATDVPLDATETPTSP